MSSNLFYNRILDSVIKNVDNDLTLEKIGKIITRFTIEKEDYQKSEELSLKIFLEYFNKYKDNIDTKCFLPTTNIEISKEDVAYLIKRKIDEYDNKKNKDFFPETISEAKKKDDQEKKLISIIYKLCAQSAESLTDADDIALYKENIDLVNKIINQIFGTQDSKSITIDADDKYQLDIYLRSLHTIKVNVSSSLGKLIEIGILRDFFEDGYEILDYDGLVPLSKEQAYKILGSQMATEYVIDLLKYQKGIDSSNDMSFINFFDYFIDKDQNYAADLLKANEANNLIQILKDNFDIFNYEFRTKKKTEQDGQYKEKIKTLKLSDTLRICDENNNNIDVTKIEEIIFLEFKKSLILPSNSISVFDFYIPAVVQYKNSGDLDYKTGIIKEFLALESKFSTTNRVTQEKLTKHKTSNLITKNSQVIYAIETVNKKTRASSKDIIEKEKSIGVDINFKCFYIKDLAAMNGYYKATKEIDKTSLNKDIVINVEDFNRARISNFIVFITACLNLKMGDIYSNFNSYLESNSFSKAKSKVSVLSSNHTDATNANVYISAPKLVSFLTLSDDDLFEKVNNIEFGAELQKLSISSITQHLTTQKVFDKKEKRYVSKFTNVTTIAAKYVKKEITIDDLIDYINENIPIHIIHNNTAVDRNAFRITCISFVADLLKFIKFISCINDNLSDTTNAFIHSNSWLTKYCTEDFIKGARVILDDLSRLAVGLDNLDTNKHFLDSLFINNTKIEWHAANIHIISRLKSFKTGEIYHETVYKYPEHEKRRLENKSIVPVDIDMLDAIKEHLRFVILKELIECGWSDITVAQIYEQFYLILDAAYNDSSYEGINELARKYINNRENIVNTILNKFDTDILSYLPDDSINAILLNDNDFLTPYEEHETEISAP